MLSAKCWPFCLGLNALSSRRSMNHQEHQFLYVRGNLQWQLHASGSLSLLSSKFWSEEEIFEKKCHQHFNDSPSWINCMPYERLKTWRLSINSWRLRDTISHRPWSRLIQVMTYWLNPLHAKFFRGNINIYLHFVSYLHIDTTQVVEILLQIREEPTYSTKTISWLLMSWQRKEPGHQQPWHWPS